MKDYYEILGVPPKASRGEIRAAWRKAAFEWHPDRHDEDRDAAHEKFVDLGEAFAVLADNKARVRYDRERPQGPAPEIELEPDPGPKPPHRRPIVDEDELEETVDQAATDARFFRHEDLIRSVMESLAAASPPVRRRMLVLRILALVGSPVLLFLLLEVLPDLPSAYGRTVVAALLAMLTGAVFWMTALAYRSRKAEAFREYAETLVRGRARML